jgi:predicted enzyme related to lactoylglutathione lyase
MKVTAMSGQVVHFEIPAEDFDRASEFYRSAFGWDISPVPEIDYAMVGTTPSDAEGSPLEPGSINGGLMLRDKDRTGPIVTIDVADIDEALRKIGELGGTTVLPKQPVMEMGYAAYFTDSEGNVMGLWQNA